MFCVLGEGRGHMTEAIAVKQMAERAGHKVVSVVLGMGLHRQAPPFFASEMKVPVETITTVDFSCTNNRKVNLAATLLETVRNVPAFWRGVRTIREVARRSDPDVIVNFFEPLTGLYALTHHSRPPVVAVGHQFMCGHPDYVRYPAMRLQQAAMRWYVRLLGARSTRVALSFYEAPDLPGQRITVSPPVLRRQLFELEPDPNGEFVLLYLLNHGYAEQIIQWHNRNPRTVLHCFYDKPGAPAEFRHDATLTFHRLDGEKFLRMMARSKCVACTAGFQSLSEAAYLGKPILMVPVENHVEQQVNAADAVRTGFGVRAESFDLDRLAELPQTFAFTRFRAWVSRADSVFLQALEHAVQAAGEAHHPVHLKPERSGSFQV
jgi:uncharacterized protein (TIGR00661 family)